MGFAVGMSICCALEPKKIVRLVPKQNNGYGHVRYMNGSCLSPPLCRVSIPPRLTRMPSNQEAQAESRYHGTGVLQKGLRGCERWPKTSTVGNYEHSSLKHHKLPNNICSFHYAF